MSQPNINDLYTKLRKIEALSKSTTFAGEQSTAQQRARELRDKINDLEQDHLPNLLKKLKTLQETVQTLAIAGIEVPIQLKEQIQELNEKIEVARYRAIERENKQPFKFSIHDPWQRRLFMAMCRARGYEPYRLKFQRNQTLMVYVEPSMQELIWNEFNEAANVLVSYLSDVTASAVRDVYNQEDREANEIVGELPR